MSQLYKIFCEGLVADHHSTVIMTSTPVEEEDDEDVEDEGVLAKPTQTAAQPLANQGSKETASESPHFSVQGQVGSDETENPPLRECGVYSPATAAPAASATASLGTSGFKVPGKRPADSEKVTQCDDSLVPPGEPFDAANHSSQHLKDRNPNVSPVDFIDHLIAVKRRDEALGKNKICSAKSSQSPKESLSHNVVVAHASSRTCYEACESSETDFSDASDILETFPTQNPFVQAQSAHSNSSPKILNLSSPIRNESPRTKSSLSNQSDGSNINLALEDISATSSLCESSLSQGKRFEDTGLPYLSAARCRIFLKPQDHQHNPVQENKPEGSQLINVKEVVSDIQASKQFCHLLKVANSNTKLSTVLKGVTAYVEVRSGHDNRSMGVRTQLRALGAMVVEKFSKEVTHVIFNEGSPATLRRARKQGCHLVSVLWIDECKKSGQIAAEANHPPLNLHLYSVSSKYRKMKSLQPDFEEGKSEERLNMLVRRLRTKSQRAGSSQLTNRVEASEATSDEEIPDQNPTIEQSECSSSRRIILKNLRIVLHKIDAVDSSSISQKRKKRRLLPIEQESFGSLSLEDFNPTVRLRLELPNSCYQKPRRIVKKSSASQTLHRRSSCFVHGTQGFAGSQQKKVKSQMRTMVCTFMHRRDIDVVAAVIKQLGGWILEPTVSQRTTHVVCGESKRTINLLRGIAHGCWILHQEWVMRSLEAGYWLHEEPFELTLFPAIQQSRVARETLGVCPDIFNTAGAIFVAKVTTPPQSDILDLLKLCGAHIVKSARQARVIIGQYQRRISHPDVLLIKEQWVLDSIQENMLQPLRHYHI